MENARTLQILKKHNCLKKYYIIQKGFLLKSPIFMFIFVDSHLKI